MVFPYISQPKTLVFHTETRPELHLALLRSPVAWPQVSEQFRSPSVRDAPGKAPWRPSRHREWSKGAGYLLIWGWVKTYLHFITIYLSILSYLFLSYLSIYLSIYLSVYRSIYMYLICILYVYYMYIICILYVYYMYICILYYIYYIVYGDKHPFGCYLCALGDPRFWLTCGWIESSALKDPQRCNLFHFFQY